MTTPETTTVDVAGEVQRLYDRALAEYYAAENALDKFGQQNVLTPDMDFLCARFREARRNHRLAAMAVDAIREAGL